MYSEEEWEILMKHRQTRCTQGISMHDFVEIYNYCKNKKIDFNNFIDTLTKNGINLNNIPETLEISYNQLITV